MRDFLAEVHFRAYAFAAVVCTLAVACASMRLGVPAAVAMMAAGVILMWISEEEKRVVAAMASSGDPMPAPDLAPAPSSARISAPASAPTPVLEPVPGRGSAVRIREWANSFPAPQPARRDRQAGRRAGARRA